MQLFGVTKGNHISITQIHFTSRTQAVKHVVTAVTDPDAGTVSSPQHVTALSEKRGM